MDENSPYEADKNEGDATGWGDGGGGSSDLDHNEYLDNVRKQDRGTFNPYAAGGHDAFITVSADVDQPFYVVAKWKCILMYFGTFGFYGIYWMYRHWKRYKESTGFDCIPILRGIFGIFFYHSLFQRIKDKANDKGIETTWIPGIEATVLVLLFVFSTILGLLEQNGLVMALSLGIVVVNGLIFMRAQAVANLACGDSGQSNNRLTLANLFWLLLGAIWWFFVLVGVVMIALGEA